MKNLLINFMSWLVRMLFSLRYKIHVKGLENLTPENLSRKGGILFLPNHPAELDPIILMLLLHKKFTIHPLVVEHFYYLTGVEFFMDLVGAIPLPNLSGATNKWKVRQIEKTLQRVEQGIYKRENFLIYPAGRLKGTEKEIIGGASLIHSIISNCPETNIVLVRTEGLWGSMFSRALTGKSPDFGATFWRGIKILLKNGIFFAPRREVTIEMVPNPKDFPFKATRLELNQYLENWYNTPLDKLKLVSYSRWREEFPVIPKAAEVKNGDSSIPIPLEVEQAVLAQVAKLAQKKPADLKRAMNLAQDLGLDSLDIAELSVFLEERFEVPAIAPNAIQTIDDLLLAAIGKKDADQEERQVPKKINGWFLETHRPSVQKPTGKTIQEAFLQCCQRMGKSIACADDLSGVLTYEKLRLAALVLSKQIAPMPGRHIGIMLPATNGAYLTILAVLLAGKVPVMFNWTSGRRALDHAIDVSGVEVVLSSYRFLSRTENNDFGKLEEKLQFLEELKRHIPLKDKLKALLTWKNPNFLLKKLKLNTISQESPAVILFTSGTETLPKGVPLTHHNLLSNQRGALDCVRFESSDCLFGILPPFHSFGFSLTGLLPLLSGLKVLYAPDPTDSRGLAYDIALWKPTVFGSAPGFIANLYRVAAPEDLKSLRLIFSGAEKTPQELFDKVKEFNPDTKLIEGYGITECSPVVTIERVGQPHKGVGQPVPGVELCIIDVEKQTALAQGQEGEICIWGPNVFHGYLGAKVDPFIFVSDRIWYRSGDRGIIDTDGTLILSGRLKRFIKIGGEMVSLGGLENDLAQASKEKNWPVSQTQEGPSLAITAKERNTDKPEIVLFTTFDVSKDEVNAVLKEKGMGRIVKISEVRKIEQIPLTGTGKTHYRLLDELCQKN